MSQRFYVNCPLAPGPVTLEGAEAHHLAMVCRLRPADQVYLFNGDGRQYRAQITAVAKRNVSLEVLTVEQPVRELLVPVGVALPWPRGDRAQFVVEKLTELGVACLTPLRTARSVVHPRDMGWQRAQRWVIEASKQCGRNTLMTIAPLADWSTFCRRSDLPAARWLAHPGQAVRLRDVGPPQRDGLTLAVGPEGGFTDDEIATAQAAGWQLVSLGPRMLRVETAAIVLAAWAAWMVEG